MKIKEEYKRILCGILGVSTALTITGCAKLNGREFPDMTARTYVVQEGDTLYDISMKSYGTYEYFNEIADYNGIKNADLIKPGDVIKLPQKGNFVYYKVKEGDTLTSICQNRYGRNDEDIIIRLATYNDLKSPDRITAGSVILVPEIEILEELVPYNYNFEKILK